MSRPVGKLALSLLHQGWTSTVVRAREGIGVIVGTHPFATRRSTCGIGVTQHPDTGYRWTTVIRDRFVNLSTDF